MSSDGLALVAAGAAAAGLMWCVNAKRMDAPLPESSVCASARRAETVSARRADTVSARRADTAVVTGSLWDSDLWHMSEDGATASKDMGGSTMAGMPASKLVAIQSSTKWKEPVETTNYKRRGTNTNVVQMVRDDCNGAQTYDLDPTRATFFGLPMD